MEQLLHYGIVLELCNESVTYTHLTSTGGHCSVDRNKYQIQIPLPPKIDPSVTMMTVEEKPDVTYNDVGGCKEQIEKMREVSMLSIVVIISLLATVSYNLVLIFSGC